MCFGSPWKGRPRIAEGGREAEVLTNLERVPDVPQRPRCGCRRPDRLNPHLPPARSARGQGQAVTPRTFTPDLVVARSPDRATAADRRSPQISNPLTTQSV